MDINSFIQNNVLHLNIDWFKAKQNEFLLEWTNDNQNLNHIHKVLTNDENDFVLDIDFISYCWNGNFRFSNKDVNYFEESDYDCSALDSSSVSEKIILKVGAYIGNSYAVSAYEKILHSIHTIQECIDLLKVDSDENDYNLVLDDFVIRTTTNLNNQYSNVKEELTKLFPSKYNKQLDIEICNRIADFTLNGRRLVTSVSSELSKGETLLNILTIPFDNSHLKIYIEDWKHTSVYYLFLRLLEKYPNANTIAQIEKYQIFFNHGRRFSRGAYDPWISKHSGNFKSKKEASEIESLLLFI